MVFSLTLGGCGLLLDESAPEPAFEFCPVLVDEGVVAFYDFEEVVDHAVKDRAGGHTGAIVGPGPVLREGPNECGQALLFRPARADLEPGFMEIPDDPAWDLPSGAIGLLLRTPELGVRKPFFGIFSRHSEESGARGSIALAESEGRLVLRMQTGGESVALCSPVLGPGRWFQLGINFGPPKVELWVNGRQANATTQVAFGDAILSCGHSASIGIEGNDRPWILGALTEVDGFAEGATIDNFWVSKTRRDFGVLRADSSTAR